MITNHDILQVFNILKSRDKEIICKNKVATTIFLAKPYKIYNMDTDKWAEYLSILAFPNKLAYNDTAKQIQINKVKDSVEYLLAQDYISIEKDVFHNYMVVTTNKEFKESI